MKMSVLSTRIRSIETKRKDNQMLSLSYTIEKEGVSILEVEKLMLNESQINNLMDSLVAHGYDVVEMSVADATL